MGKGASPSPCSFLGFVRHSAEAGADKANACPSSALRTSMADAEAYSLDPRCCGMTAWRLGDARNMSDIGSMTQGALADIAAADSPDALEQLRVALLGKQGSITTQLKALGTLPADQRKAAGEA